MRNLVGLLALVSTACSSNSVVGGDLGDVADAGGPDLSSADPLIAARPYNLYVPPSYDAATPAPLLVLLHGYSASGDLQELYFNFKPVADAHGFLYAYPDGTVEASAAMNRFWNATDACCNFLNSTVDDSGYLSAVLGDITARYSVDAKRVYIVGHSNGGFMTHRMACDHAARLAAVVSLAGDTFLDQSKCAADGKVSVLQVQGDADATVAYAGGMYVKAYPGARATIADWATKNGCSGALVATGATLDLDTSLVGAETTVEAFGGCPSDGAAELWTIHGGGHLPRFQTDPSLMTPQNPSWGELVWAWLAAHPRP